MTSSISTKRFEVSGWELLDRVSKQGHVISLCGVLPIKKQKKRSKNEREGFKHATSRL